MTRVRATYIGNQAFLLREELDRLIFLARQVEDVDLQTEEEDLPALGLSLLSQGGGAFIWLEGEPDLYSLDDLKVRYQ